MKKGEPGFIFLVIILVVIIAAAIYFLSMPEIYLSPFDDTTISFSLDVMEAKIDKPLTVRLNVVHQPPTPFYDIVQFIPQGFAIEYGGTSIPRPDLARYYPGTNPVQFLVFNPSSAIHSYVLVPNSFELCPLEENSQFLLHGRYLAPPEKPKDIFGQSSIFIQKEMVTRTFSKPQAALGGEITVYLHVYPACSNSYTIWENIPSEFTVVNTAGGILHGGMLSWSKSCPGVCPSTVFAYKMRGESGREGLAAFEGSYSMGDGPVQKILGESALQIVEVDCLAPGACGKAACQGEYCDAQQTRTCFNNQCVDSCTGREGYYCSDSCEFSDNRYTKGDASCGIALCCQDMPEQSCEAAGGYCVLDENLPFLECPPGFVREPQYDLTCNGEELPLASSSYPICCVLPHQQKFV